LGSTAEDDDLKSTAKFVSEGPERLETLLVRLPRAGRIGRPQ
jgi:hypothetical protein